MSVIFLLAAATLATAALAAPAIPKATEAPKLSAPVWVISPKDNDANLLRLESGSEKIAINTSNNNLAIKLFNGRLYFAFRTATHHHPKPPIWSPQYLGVSQPTTRMYVLSAKLPDDFAKRPFDEAVASLTWRVELEMNDTLRKECFGPHLEALLSPDEKASHAATAWFEATFGEKEALPLLSYALNDKGKYQDPKKAEADVFQDFKSLIEEFDLREPLFMALNGKLHFYFQQVEGKAMTFNSLRTWHLSLDGEKWTTPETVLSPKEHFWEIQIRKENKTQVAYLTSYSGAHYVINQDELDNAIHFRRSTDGSHWTAVEGRESVYQGGASEAAFLFPTVSDKLWAVIRLDDGDQHGWGSLVATAPAAHPAEWKYPDRADPRRFDSPRLFADQGEMYLLARQNVCAGKDGKYDLTKNCPYDRQFVSNDEKTAERNREGIFGLIRRKLLSFKEVSTAHADTNGVTLGSNPGVSLQYEYTYYFDLPKRTALYHLDKQTGAIEEITSLPSDGDTAFTGIERLGNGEYLLANYSSGLDHPDWSWREGQQNRTGIYFLKLTFPRR